VDIAAAPASNSRIDVVYAMQRDANSTTSPDGITQGEVGVITGTAAVSPTKPAIPAGAVEVVTVTVAAGVTATTNAGCTVATTCQWTTGSGAPIPVRNATERAALTPFDGLRIYRIDNGVNERSYGGVWRQEGPFASVRGTIAVTTTSGTPNVPDTVTLPSGMFTVPPVVKVSWQSDSGPEPMLRVYSLTAASFGVDIISAPSDIGPVSGNVHWEATQTTATTA
jgi:hypothetical protein